MDPDFSGFVLDREKYSQLSLDEKKELIHEIAQWPMDAPKIFRSWTRQELADLISVELGKERKYAGVSKSKLIERLLKLVSKNSENKEDDLITMSPAKTAKTQIGSKRQRKNDYPVFLANGRSDDFSPKNHEYEQLDTFFCENLACRAKLTPDSKFCKRCSCCICFQYDDNKDPSLWLTCDSDSLNNQQASCGMSCHLKCALRHEGAGLVKHRFYKKLDGSFYCVCCGKVNGIMRSWRKQLLVAKDARRVDVLCYRIFLCHKILEGTDQYKELHNIVDTMVKKLSLEVGPIDQVSSEMARGLVSRLSCGAEVQNLCSVAIETVNPLLPDIHSHQIDIEAPPSCRIRFEDVSSVSVVVVLEYGEKLLLDFCGCRVWHRKSSSLEYPLKPTYIVLRPQKKFVVPDLDPSTEYIFKVSVFSSSKELGVWESTCATQALNANLSSVLDAEQAKEQTVTGLDHSQSQRDSTNSSDEKLVSSDNRSKVRLLEDISKNDECHLPPCRTDGAHFTNSVSVPPATPCKCDGAQEVPGSTTKKHSTESNYDYCVRVIRWLEREGHMEKDFRVKFLTWFSLKSTARDRRVITAFVDTLIDDPASLADQLVDTFKDEISSQKKQIPTLAFCTSLWH